MSFTVSPDEETYGAGEKIRCPVCRHTVGRVPVDTVCLVRKLDRELDCQPGHSSHLCTNRTGIPARKCGTFYALRSVNLAEVAAQRNPVAMRAVA